MASVLATTPPPIQAPTAKERKYDRQLRLWAANGQQALEESHVLLVIPETSDGGSGSSAAGVETLKNLVLPNIGHFTIADAAKVTEADLGVNFFLTSESIGKSRAEECKQLLEELNPDVRGHALSKPLSDLLRGASWLQSYTLIILCGPTLQDHRRIVCQVAQQSAIPLIYVQTAGFYSSFSVQLPAIFPVVDTHPDPDTIQDLRLLSPWPELVAEVEALGNLDSLDDHDHGHVPYILILLYYVSRWKERHKGKPPATFSEKTQFRDLVKAGARTANAEGSEENFDEAASAVLKTITPFTLKSGCREMFEHDLCTTLTADSANFWIIAHAIKSFYQQQGGLLPLPGFLPDMKAKSATYIKLQSIYKRKARQDVATVTATVRATEKTLGRKHPPIPEAEIEAFCKNAAHVRVLVGSLLPHIRLDQQGSGDDADARTKIKTKIEKELRNQPEDSLVPIFLALEHAGRRERLKEFIDSHGDEMDEMEYLDKVYAEVERVMGDGGGRELHNISSLTGGLVAQEAIKIITRQYVPVDNTCIYDGIKAQTQVFRL